MIFRYVSFVPWRVDFHPTQQALAWPFQCPSVNKSKDLWSEEAERKSTIWGNNLKVTSSEAPSFFSQLHQVGSNMNWPESHQMLCFLWFYNPFGDVLMPFRCVLSVEQGHQPLENHLRSWIHGSKFLSLRGSDSNESKNPRGSMGLVYLPIIYHKNQPFM